MAPPAPAPAPPRALPEILAPGGDPDAVRAAILAGADAVYLGLGRFNARLRATNVAAAELRALCRLAHSHGVRVYVTLNTIVSEADVRAAAAVGLEALDAGADALILQDLGLVGLFRQRRPEAELHASTQLTTHNQAQLEVLARAGVTQVNLSRELSLEEIRGLTARAHSLGLRVEVFVHGAYCVSFSGQCYLSALLTGLSGNRGECVQPCRRAFACGDEQRPGLPLNLKDNNAIAEAAALCAAGVDAFKIEGRRKGFYYVHTVVAAWRGRLDALGRGEAVAGDDPALGKVFNRGFSVAYLRGSIDADAFAGDRDDQSLVPLGVVASYSADHRTLHCEGGPVLRPGVRAGVYTDDMDYVGRFVVEGVVGPGCVRVRLEHELKGKIRRGQQLFALAEQTEADAILAQARALEVRRVPLAVTVAGALGQPLSARCSVGDRAVTVASGVALQAATRSELDEAQLRRHLGKLGETELALGAVDTAALAPGLFLPVSELNRMRQAAVERLTAAAAAAAAVSAAAAAAVSAAAAAAAAVSAAAAAAAATAAAAAASAPAPAPLPLRQRLLFLADGLDAARALRAVAGREAFVGLELQGPGDRPAPAPGDDPLEEWLVPIFPAVAFDDELTGFAATLGSRPWRLVMSENVGLGARAAAAGIPWIAGGLLNTANAGALATLGAVAGAGAAVLSPELSVSQIRRLGGAAAGPGLLRLATIFGPLLCLQTRQCLVRDFKRCRLPQVVPTCVPECRAAGRLALEPEQRFHAVKRPGFQSQLWDARVLCYPEAIGALGAAVDGFVVDLRDPGFLGRTPDETLRLARGFRDAVDAGRCAGAALQQLRRLAGSGWRGPLGRAERPAPTR